MSGPDTRPEVRVAFINEDGTVDTTGQWGWQYFETLPEVGDIIVGPSMLDDSPEAVVVVGRQFIRRRGLDQRWWIIVRPAAGSRWREVCQLDEETDQAFDEMRAERSRSGAAEFLGRKKKKPRR